LKRKFNVLQMWKKIILWQMPKSSWTWMPDLLHKLLCTGLSLSPTLWSNEKLGPSPSWWETPPDSDQSSNNLKLRKRLQFTVYIDETTKLSFWKDKILGTEWPCAISQRIRRFPPTLVFFIMCSPTSISSGLVHPTSILYPSPSLLSQLRLRTCHHRLTVGPPPFPPDRI
jgi:hypothetical protein